jgi:hypothetical protein
MSALEDARAVLTRAWSDPGPVPQYHYAMRAELTERWPVLARAIEQLIATTGESPTDDEREVLIATIYGTPTLGHIANVLSGMKSVGVTRASIIYALDRVFWEETS